VRDAQPRSGGVGGRRSPADDTLTLHVQARDRGLGPERATVYLDGTAVDTAAFGDGRCAGLSPGSSQIDLPFGLVGQNDVVDPATLEFTRIGCLGLGTAELSVDTTRVTDGRHTIVQKGRGTVGPPPHAPAAGSTCG
jgi:hypothetical protein